MAENFRNKQWFKNMSQERKDEICKKFLIDEVTLKKSGRETNDGRIVINLLKIDKLNYMPESWKEYNKIISANTVNACEGTIEEQLENLKFIYGLFNEVKFLKYKQSVHNDLMITQSSKYVNHWITKYNKEDSDKEFCSYQIFTHVKSLFETDLNLIKI